MHLIKLILEWINDKQTQNLARKLTTRLSGGCGGVTHTQKLLHHISNDSKRDEESRPSREVVVSNICGRTIVEGQETSTESVKDSHDTTSNGGNKSRVTSEGGEEGDEEGDDKSNAAFIGCGVWWLDAEERDEKIAHTTSCE